MLQFCNCILTRLLKWVFLLSTIYDLNEIQKSQWIEIACTYNVQLHHADFIRTPFLNHIPGYYSSTMRLFHLQSSSLRAILYWKRYYTISNCTFEQYVMHEIERTAAVQNNCSLLDCVVHVYVFDLLVIKMTLENS